MKPFSRTKIRRRIFSLGASVLLMLSLVAHASACTLFYAGGDLTDDGANLFIRVEDLSPYAFNKVSYVSPAGNHAKGEAYQGCFGFTWTFTHDSYRYTALRDDNLSGVCPNCGGTHPHTPFEEAGTNDHGVTVSATESLFPYEAIEAADPFVPDGIGEAEITTVLLSEASTAREGLSLLLGIFDNAGAKEASGTMIADQNEQWYVECLSGHSYIALLLPRDVAFLQPNLSVLGRIDLDDRGHVIASEDFISTALKAGTFAGDAAENIIDCRASYNYRAGTEVNWADSVSRRLVSGQNFLTGKDDAPSFSFLEDNLFTLTNVSGDGKITSLHNSLVLKDKIGIDEVFALYRVEPIGRSANVEAHLFRFYPDEEQIFGTVEWSTMGDCRFSAYVPSYPMLLTDTWEGCRVPLSLPAVTRDVPEGTKDYFVEDGDVYPFPENWSRSCFGTLKALSNIFSFGTPDPDASVLTQSLMLQLQSGFELEFAQLSKDLRAESSARAREELMTRSAAGMTERVHDLALALYRFFTYGESSPLIPSSM